MLSPDEGAILELLIGRGRAKWDAIDVLLRDGDSSQSVRDVHVYRIRRKFAAAGAPDPIETVRGWGLRLRILPDARRSVSLVKGGRLKN
ncbi:MAG TPA: helix-turn-helix domain-containing protein [Sphingomicrobium sp.]